MQTNTNNVNETWALLHTTGGKDEPNIVFMQTSQHDTQNVMTHNRTTQKTKQISETEHMTAYPEKSPTCNKSLPTLLYRVHRAMDGNRTHVQ